jgi:hypothetical protein
MGYSKFPDILYLQPHRGKNMVEKIHKQPLQSRIEAKLYVCVGATLGDPATGLYSNIFYVYPIKTPNQPITRHIRILTPETENHMIIILVNFVMTVNKKTPLPHRD